jgi:HEAT repeat protein
MAHKDDQVNELIKRLQALSPMPNDRELTEKQLGEYHQIVYELAQLEDIRCIRPLIESFGYGNGNGVYWEVVHLLERFAIEETDPLLLDALQSENPGTRQWSALMLGRSENQLAIPRLLQLLDDHKELVRAEAVVALGRFHKDEIKGQLLKLMDDPSKEVHAVLKIALYE